jgi:hypothetical protein
MLILNLTFPDAHPMRTVPAAAFQIRGIVDQAMRDLIKLVPIAGIINALGDPRSISYRRHVARELAFVSGRYIAVVLQLARVTRRAHGGIRMVTYLRCSRAALSSNIAIYFDSARDALVECGLAALNPRYDANAIDPAAGMPKEEEITWIGERAWRVFSFDETRVKKATHGELK